MRFMMIVKASKESEAGVMPSAELLQEMGKYNEELEKAGLMLSGTGLHPSSKGARVEFSGGQPSVTDGPFAETKELIAGYWLVKANSLEEVIGWAKRVPFQDGQIEIRQLFELDEFDNVPDEMRKQEERLSKAGSN